MKKKIKGFFICATAAALLVGCGTRDKKVDYSSYVTLGEYLGIELESYDIEISDEEIQEYSDSIIFSYATYEEVTDREVEFGDTVNIDYRGLLNDVAFEGGTAQGQILAIGSGGFIDGFEDGLIGVMPGEQIELPLTFPEEYTEELAGQDVIFEITVNYIQGEAIIPELTDSFIEETFADDLYITTVEQYLDFLRQNMEAQAQGELDAELQESLITQVLDNATITGYPEELVQTEKQQFIDYNLEYAGYFGLDLEGYLELLGKTEEELEEQAYEIAQKSVAERMIYSLIAEKEGLTLTDAELEEAAILYSFNNSQELFDEYGEDMVRETLLREKVFEFLMDNAVINVK